MIKVMVANVILRHNLQFLFNVALAYLTIAVIHYIRNISRLLSISLFVLVECILIAMFICQLFLHDIFGMEISAFALQLLNETTSKESSEFLSMYVFSTSAIKYVCIVALLLCIQTGLHMYSGNLRPFLASIHLCRTPWKASKCALSIYLWVSLSFLIWSLPLFCQSWNDNIAKSIRRGRYGIHRAFAFKIYNSILQFNDEKDDLKKCIQSQLNVYACVEGDTIEDIVLIIGESYNRHHASLYGYNKDTNPFLSKKENLHVFDDVISSINGTAPSFKNFLSTACVDSKTAWCDEPLFLTVFKNSGYNVVFNSNQFAPENNVDCWNASCGFFYHPDIRAHLFSYTNTKKYEFDEELINNYKSRRNEAEKSRMNLIIHHLNGQHVDPRQRYPQSHSHFSCKDYSERKELSEEEKEYVATYDNATRYNDSVVSMIIDMYQNEDAVIIYFADHGDEANDYRIHQGRSRGMEKLGAPCLHCQLDIPFIIYTSNTFVQKHPQTTKRISEAIHRPFMTDDLPHLMFDIAGISTKWYVPSRSPINNLYNLDRKRIIKGFSLKGSLDYDDVCKRNEPWTIGF
ncbi:MAG: phosphoethanolamine transferase [Bacteroidaceae bacterium]